jgi:hypothetical protein
MMAMRGGLLSLNKIQSRLERISMLGYQASSTQLRVSAPAPPNDPQATLPPSGSASALQMVSTFSISEGTRGSPRIVEYQVTPDEGGTVKLMVYERLYAGPASVAGFCSETIAIQGSPQFLMAAGRLAYCRFSYRQIDPDTQFRGPNWVPVWGFLTC